MSGFSISEILSPVKPASPVIRQNEVDVTSSPSAQSYDVTSDSGYTSPVPSLTSSPPQVATPFEGFSGLQLYSHLQTSLAQESYSPPWTLLAASPLATSLEPTSVPAREHRLRMLFCDPHLNALYPHQVRELQCAYESEVRRLVNERHLSMQSVLQLPWLQQPLDYYYQSQHLALIDRVQRSLSLLQATSFVPPPPAVNPLNFVTSTPKARKSPAGRKSRQLSERAVRIMEKWYTDNQEHPYPSYDSCEIMAEAGDISVEQVKKWFANRRLRRKNTKTLTEIARRRKVSRPSVDLVNAAWMMS